MAIPSSGQPEDVPGTPSTTEPVGPVLGAVDPPAGPVTDDGDSTNQDVAPGSTTTEGTPGRAARRDTPKKGGPLAFLRELPALLLIAFVLALLIKSFLVQAFYIPSESMVPTLKVGDRVLVNKLTYRFHPPGRGDIIVFEDPNAPPTNRGIVSGFVHWVTDGLGLTTSPDKDFIKRVIGLPGDTVEIRRGNVFINGSRMGPEPYLSPIADVSCCPGQSWTVPPDKLFVMGDNRTNSSDSRTSLGFIPISKVVGRAFVIIWPPSRIHWLSTPKYSL
jgi:signal peptidase I